MDSRTGLFALIGDPVGHSKSPDMMNAALREVQLPNVYLAFKVAPSDLKDAVAGFRALGVKGWNVTIPHKVAIMDYLDAVDETAQAIGAVNTVVYEHGKWVGYNTDGPGYLRSVEEAWSLPFFGLNVVIIGAGGAARAVGYTLAKAGVSRITVLNRTLAKAEALGRHLSSLTRSEALPLTEGKKVIEKADLIINTTSVGMFPDRDETPVPVEWFQRGQYVSDLIYHPRETTLLRGAKARGARVLSGLDMLVYQAVIAFEKWTEKEAPVSLMKQVLAASLKDT
ncbi:shikimate dehydrogenase [Thermoactinomyces mirandus]|uniref:shikimate dehydrogenase n=1 Tax=Thermoactinomyces mirandus TaxID=2756294 RepID=UPI0028B1A6B8|nr:shikimate dehydrogenase [Thermoactinomyces mirandus]